MSKPKSKELDLYIYFPHQQPMLLLKKLTCDAELVCETILEKHEKGKESSVEKIKIDRFKLRDIEQVMRNHGWEMGAKAQALWFSGKAYQLPERAKNASEDDSMIDKVLSNAVEADFVDWDWLLSFTIVREKLDHLLMTKETLISKNIYDPNMLEYYYIHDISHNIYSSRTKDSLINNFKSDKDKDQHRFGYCFGQEILQTHKNGKYIFSKEIENIYFYHRYWQFQYIRVGDGVSEKPWSEDDIEDWFAAFGSFTLNVAPYEIEIIEIEKGVYQVNILKVAIYARDSFDFNGNQYLGFWNKKGICLPIKESFSQAMYLLGNTSLDKIEKIAKTDIYEINTEVDYAIDTNIITTPLLKNGDNVNKDLYFPVNNSDYRRWRENSKNKDPNGIGFGRDMILFSKIKIQDIEGLSIIVRIEDERNIKK
ncbi:DUF6402 family protein [Peptostreptococcus porci]|uniref:DUF6402 family protein n=1 Tax=Peptostreptococcus porci TaxID=2652282 RepID=UPI002A91D7EB|nr:DUF6402 family protein [Peptostreptococcus porci]MDY5435338.1 DUF6402 family protein [Peptostreptococcus porci]